MDEELQRYYEESYSAVTNSGASGTVQRRFHMAVERPRTANQHFGRVLELGATNAEHLHFVHHDFHDYVMLDINDSAEARRAATASTTDERRFAFRMGDAQSLEGIDDQSFDRVISMCLLHHLERPDVALRRWRDVTVPGGVIDIFIPCDPGLLWRIGRRLTTFRAARQRGYSWPAVRYLNALDHKNHVAALLALIDGTFAEDTVQRRWFPLHGIPTWNGNVFLTVHIKKTGANP